ncbi:molybdopterin binding oxidoreductase [Xylaria sp. FL1042]|nr:molybdopterin binding oxidoreductase [Xylaria sp. FL1042]
MAVLGWSQSQLHSFRSLVLHGSELIELYSFITSGSAYDRNHGPIPRIRRDEHRVRVDGAVSNPLSLSVHDLVTSFPQHEVVCVLQCASNRRHTMRTSLKEVDGIDWGDAALMNCSWRGPRLCDILERAGVARGEQDAHVGFAYEATETQNDCWYGASTELARALDRDNDIIVATERNSVLLSAEHGAPVRIIVPGVAGARSVKWVDHITVQQKESSNYYQNRDYKVLPEHVSNAQEAEGYWDTTPALQDMPVNSVVALPRCGETISAEQDGCIVVRGYAVPGGRDGPVTKVEISVDGQKTWTEATIRGSPSKCPSKGSNPTIFCRTFDKGGNEQAAKPSWNLRGVVYNGYGESRDVTVT